MSLQVVLHDEAERWYTGTVGHQKYIGRALKPQHSVKSEPVAVRNTGKEIRRRVYELSVLYYITNHLRQEV